MSPRHHLNTFEILKETLQYFPLRVRFGQVALFSSDGKSVTNLQLRKVCNKLLLGFYSEGIPLELWDSG